MQIKDNPTLIVAPGRLKLKIAKSLQVELSNEGRRVIIITDQDTSQENQSVIKNLESYQYDETGYSRILSDAHNLIRGLKQAKLDDQSSFRDLTVYQGVALWEMSIYYLLPEFMVVLKNFNLILRIIDLECPQQIIILGKIERLERLFGLIGSNKKINIQSYNKDDFIGLWIKRRILAFVYFNKKIWRFIKSVYFKILNHANARKEGPLRKHKVIFFNTIERKLEVLLPIIQRYAPDERLLVNMPFSGGESRLKQENISYRYFYGYKLSGILSIKVNKFIDKIWKTLDSDKSFQSLLCYKQIMLWPVLRDVFWFLLYRKFCENIRNVDMTRKIILSNEAKAVIVADYLSEVVLPAQALSVPTISVMPSASHDQCYFDSPMADYVMSTGNFWKKQLIERARVNPEQIFVIGPTRFDLAPNGKLERDRILSELNLDGKKKTVVFASSYYFGGMEVSAYDLYIQEIRMVLRAFAKLRNVNLITKLHPFESNIEIYEKIAREEHCMNMLIIHDFNSWKLINCLDLIITNSSTLSFDTVLMGKVSILISSASKYYPEDIWDFKNSQAALFVNDFRELTEIINKALYDDGLRSVLKEGRERYIVEHAAPLDGRASYRAKELIDKIIYDLQG